MFNKIKPLNSQIRHFMCNHPYIAFYLLFIGVPISLILAVSTVTFIAMFPIDFIMNCF